MVLREEGRRRDGEFDGRGGKEKDGQCRGKIGKCARDGKKALVP